MMNNFVCVSYFDDTKIRHANNIRKCFNKYFQNIFCAFYNSLITNKKPAPLFQRAGRQIKVMKTILTLCQYFVCHPNHTGNRQPVDQGKNYDVDSEVKGLGIYQRTPTRKAKPIRRKPGKVPGNNNQAE
jgi:hypothetical protein